MACMDTTEDVPVPDLADIPPGRLAALGGTALARAITLYRERLKEPGVPLSAFNSLI